jgi:16S rRNA (guanine527-N7)-methyltransferase
MESAIESHESHALWQSLAQKADLTLQPNQIDQLSRYLDLLLEANKTMNLTRISDRAAAEIGHIGDALTLLPFLPRKKHQLADVGSGGGVPGIPLAIARPDVSIFLLEATQKKAAFLTQTSLALGLKNVQILAERAEAVNRGPLRETFNIATARAVGSINDLVEWCFPLIKPGGKLLAMKGAKAAEELIAAASRIRRLKGNAPRVHPVPLPGADYHVIVEIAKR